MNIKNSALGRVKKRYMILLEVMIALALIALCVIPLLAPHAFLLKQQRKFISTVELDHAVNLLYVEVLEKMYEKKISWQSIQEGVVFPVEEEALKRVNGGKALPFVGSYRFEKGDSKFNVKEHWGTNLLKLTFTFLPKEGIADNEKEKEKQTLKYSYKVFVNYLADKNQAADEGSGASEKEKSADPSPPPQTTRRRR